MEFRPVLMIIGALTATLGVAMFLPAIADAAVGNPDWIVFVASGLFTALAGAGAWAASSGGARQLSTRQAFMLTALVWIVLSAFGSLPLFWSGLGLSFTDAVFESVSGLTTTGATIMTELESAPPGLLLWRGLLQWFGGLGIVVMAIAVLPMLQVGGMQMFRAEAFETPDKILPRAAQIAGGMTAIYVGLTAACAAFYWGAGMSLFDAIVHSMTTLATGGYSTRNGSIESYHSTAIDYIAVAFMILGSLPFLLYLRLLRGQVWSLLRDSQVKTFLSLIAVTSAIIVGVQVGGGFHTGEEAVRHALFSVTSVMTGTGYATIDYGAWGPLSVTVFFIITFFGGCAGSTSCGIKTFRLQVLYIDLRHHIQQILFPSGVFVRRYNRRPLPETVSASVMSFVFIYLLAFFVLALALSLTGLDSTTALSGAATAISNVGPGLGEIIGPTGTFQPLSDISKWLLAAGMILGRLELFTVLVLFMPRFWRG